MDESYGICRLTYIPVRSEPSERAEMVSQLLYGEIFTIFEKTVPGSFSGIKMVYDGYEGWIDSKMITHIDKDTFTRYSRNPGRVIKKPILLRSSVNDQSAWLSSGSVINFEETEVKIGRTSFPLPGDITDTIQADLRGAILSSARQFLNVPYLWGGRSSFGTDCSGLVQNIYWQAGITLPRDASQQAQYGTTLSFISEAQPSDLAFFDNEEGEIIHVGIIGPDRTVIHASGCVRTDHLDHQGIFNDEMGKYSHKLRVIKNIIDS